jgi:ubiquinone/menaquinone biosynthesis C-methylase UbiE
LDPEDIRGRKNAYIDTLHKIALAQALGNRHFNRALDFGCGTGRFLRFLAKRSDDVIAVDRTPEMMDVARLAFPMAPDRFIVTHEASLPFPDNAFDIVLSVYVISCAPSDDFDRLIDELKRVCSFDGFVALIEQVDNDRGLAPATYSEAFTKSAEFELIEFVPIRAGSSRYVRLAKNRWVPHAVHAALAHSEMSRMARARFTAETRGYWDFLAIAKKRLVSVES